MKYNITNFTIHHMKLTQFTAQPDLVAGNGNSYNPTATNMLASQEAERQIGSWMLLSHRDSVTEQM